MSIEILRRELRDHIEFDHQLQERLVEGQEKLLVASTELQADMRQVKKDVAELRQKVIEGNGKEPLLTRVRDLEIEVDRNKEARSLKREFIRWLIPALIALSALGVSIFSLLQKTS